MGEFNFLDFLEHQITNSDECLTGEFLLLGDRVLGDIAAQERVSKLVTGMALASMGICREFDAEGYRGFLLALSETVERELERERDMAELPLVH